MISSCISATSISSRLSVPASCAVWRVLTPSHNSWPRIHRRARERGGVAAGGAGAATRKVADHRLSRLQQDDR
jgi:hypothetical protein